MKVTNIEWTDFSSNPLQYRDATGKVVWACVKHSSGCANCYSEAIAERFDRVKAFTRANMEGLTPFLDEKELKHILTAKTVGGKGASGSRCFLGDMTDVFGEWVPDELLDRLFAVLALRGDVTFQLLTKRADRMRAYVSAPDRHAAVCRAAEADGRRIPAAKGDLTAMLAGRPLPSWPLKNVWLGTSVENQAAADARIPHLLATPAAVRFLSCEPLLGPVDLKLQCNALQPGDPSMCDTCDCVCAKLHWVIVGGESGPGARPMNLEWARGLVRQCNAANVACFVKQMGSDPYYVPTLEEQAARQANSPIKFLQSGERHHLAYEDKKGGEPSEWPEDLRIRQFPPAA